MFHIGILQLTQNLDDAVRGFKQKLDELQLSVRYTYRNVDGNVNLLSQAAADLAAEGVDLIFACSTPSALAARDLPGNIPVLFTPVFDPVSAGLVASLSAPGGKVTGMSGMVTADKKIQLIKDLLPSAKKLCVLVPASDQNSCIEMQNFRQAAQGEFTLHEIVLDAASDISLLEEKFSPEDDALFLPIGRIIEENFSSIAYYAEAFNLPIIASHAPNVVMGALGGLFADHAKLGAACAVQAEEILVQKKDPATIAAGLPQDPDLLLNAFVAENLDIEIPASLMEKAKEIYR